jgi:hypothetical protein
VNTVSLLRDQLKQSHEFLELVMNDVTPEQVHWTPPGIANPLGATYAHLVMSEDGFVNGMLKGSAPLMAGAWASKTGLSEPPPSAPGESWYLWAKQARVDLGALRQYAQAVYAATDQFLASLADSDLTRPIDLTAFGLGNQTLAWILSNGVLGHVHGHGGEIACLKGLQGAKGSPF